MLDRITKRVANEILATVPGMTEEKAEQIDYGLYMAISDSLKLALVILAALLLGQLKYALVAVLTFSINKSVFGGVHAKTQIGCIITHFTLIFGSIYLSSLINLSYLNYVLFAISGILIYLYAPADLESKPIITEKRYKELKIKGWLAFVLWFLVSLFVPLTYCNIISIITFITSVNLTPLVYKITRNRKGGVLT